jgi:hypothetical protein
MPCYSPEPNDREIESVLVSELICYLFTKKNKKVPKNVIQVMNDPFGNVSLLDKHTEILCSECKKLTEEEQDSFMYDGRNADARKLAAWWERHSEFDKERERREDKKKNHEKLRKQALSKLTKEERKALGF